MGVYVFRSVHEPYVKIGKYTKNNPWSRVAHRGFYSCLHPKILQDRVGVHDVDLVFWFPSFGRREEKKLHESVKEHRVIGEWFHESCLAEISSTTRESAVECPKDWKDLALNTRKRL
jgi:hypothetical protein